MNHLFNKGKMVFFLPKFEQKLILKGFLLKLLTFRRKKYKNILFNKKIKYPG